MYRKKTSSWLKHWDFILLDLILLELSYLLDIVGTPVEGKDYIIGSCKYRNEKIGVDELDLIRDYASVFGKGNNYHYYIFSKGGFTDELLQAQERGEVRLITLEDLYK